ncbi:hypothetical protein HDV06_006511 [Boothiomyces sp. JEL0866]|nr:hypothetical protein HDV06_006511 [Boothiomyces sp. JEL0866]
MSEYDVDESRASESAQEQPIVIPVQSKDDDSKSDHLHSQTNLKKENALERYFTETANVLKERYYSKVSYRKESLLLLLLLFPFAGIAFLLPFMNSIVFASAAYAVGLKVVVVLLGLISTKVSHIINQRHSVLEAMAQIINNEATIKTICDSIDEVQHNKFLDWITFIFYACLIATQLSIQSLPYVTPYGTATANVLTTQITNLSNIGATAQEIMYATIGSQFSCVDCESFSSGNVLIVPVSSTLTSNLAQANQNVILSGAQDVISVQATCFTLYNPLYSTLGNVIQITQIELAKGVGSIQSDVQISGVDSNGNVVSRQCAFMIGEYQADAGVRYNIDENGFPTRISVNSIGGNSGTCGSVGNLCLGAPSRPSLAFSLYTTGFPTNITINKLYGTLKLFPDPGSSITDLQFGEQMKKFLSLNLLMTASSFPSTRLPCTLMTDDVAVKMNIDPVLMWLSIVTASVASIIAILLIVTDLIKLEKASDLLLRRLSRSVQPGKKLLEDCSVLVSKLCTPGASNDDWITTPIRFGEDKATSNLALFFIVVSNQLSLVTTPVPTYLKRISIYTMNNPIAENNQNTINPIEAALGLKAICSECTAVNSKGTLLVPVTSKISDVDSTFANILVQSNQDIVAIKSTCFAVLKTDMNISSGIIQAETLGAVSVGNRNFISMLISSISSTNGKPYSQNCSVTTTDLNSNVSAVYSKSALGPYRYSGIYSVNNSTLSNCTLAGAYCLDDSKRNTLSISLLGTLATAGTSEILKSETLNIYPDPSVVTNEASFSLQLSYALGKIMVMQALSLSASVDYADVYNTSTEFQIRIEPTLRMLQIALAALCILFDAGRVIWYTYLLRDVNDNLLRRLSRNVVPGQWQLQDLSDFIERYHKKRRWMLLPLEFGEDKHTAEEEVGRLKYGTSKMVNPITKGKFYR